MDLWKILNSTGTDPNVQSPRPTSYMSVGTTELSSASIPSDAEVVGERSSHKTGTDADTTMVESAPCASAASLPMRPQSPTGVIDESCSPAGNISGLSIAGDEAEDVQLGETVQVPVLVLVPRSGASLVIAAIEKQFETIVENLLAKQGPWVTLKTKKRSGTLSEAGDGQDVGLNPVKFLGPSQQEAWRFTVIFRILELIHEALLDNVVVSKRNIYYKDPALFKSQHIVDRYVDIIAFTFGVRRADLNVTAAAKGLVIGGFCLTHSDSRVVQHNADSDVALIGDTFGVAKVDNEGSSWILVVEKESTFRTLAFNKLHINSKAGKGIILTAKGYPDISTRAFLHLLSSSRHPNNVPPPIFALMDFDPDGIAIMSTYKHGSWTLSHENAKLKVPSIRWLGLRSRELLDGTTGEVSEGLLQLTTRDRRKAMSLLERPLLDEEGEEKEWRRELQVMLTLGVKAEMEILADRAGGVCGWVEERLLEEVGAADDIMDI